MGGGWPRLHFWHDPSTSGIMGAWRILPRGFRRRRNKRARSLNKSLMKNSRSETVTHWSTVEIGTMIWELLIQLESKCCGIELLWRSRGGCWVSFWSVDISGLWVCAINSDSSERKIQPCSFLVLWGSFGCGKSYPPMRLILVKREHLIFACSIVKFGCTACKSECPCAPCIVVANLMISVSYVCLVPRKIPTRYSTTVCNGHFSHTLHVQ